MNNEFKTILEMSNRSQLNDITQQRQQDQLKVAKIEKDINDYKSTMSQVNVNQEAKQTATGYGIISLPKNAANGQVSDIVIKGRSLKNELNYNRETWEEWAVANATKDISGLTLLADGVSIASACVNIALKTSTKYGVLLEYVSKSTVNKSLRFDPNSWIGGDNKSFTTLGNNKVVFTTPSIIAQQRFQFFYDIDTAGGHCKVRDIRLFELPIGSEIETDFDTLTADQLAIKYPYISGNGTKSTNSVRVKSVGKNLFDKSKVVVGHISDISGELKPNATTRRSSDFIKVEPNKNYFISGTGAEAQWGAWYDENKNFISGFVNYALAKTAPSNAKYIRFTIQGSEYLDTPQFEESNIATAHEPYKESSVIVNLPEPLRSLPNGVKDEVNVSDGKATQNVSEDIVVSDTVYDSLDTTTYTNVDVVITTAFADAKAGTTGADGQTHYYNKDGVELAEVAQADIDLEASVGKYYWGEDKKLYIIVAKDDYADIAAARTGLGTTSLTYQLAEPIETHVQVSGSLVSYPSGTIYVEPIVADAGIYSDKMTVLHQDLPIDYIERLFKVDFTTGQETQLDVTQCVVAADKLSFTHPNLVDGDVVFFTYFYEREGTLCETTIEYYDSRYVLKDSVTDKYYKVVQTVADGVLTNTLVEV